MEWGNLHKVRGYAGCAERCPSGVGRGKRPRRKSEPYLSVSVDELFEELEREKPEHFAVRQYKKYKLAAGVVSLKRLLNQLILKSWSSKMIKKSLEAYFFTLKNKIVFCKNSKYVRILFRQ